MKAYEFLTEAEATKSYEIKPGDTLTRIASRNGTTIDAIMDLNQGNRAIRDRDTIYAGGTIKLPTTSTGFDSDARVKRQGSTDIAKPDDIAKIGTQEFPLTKGPIPNDDKDKFDPGIDDTEWEFPTVELGFGDPGYLPLTGKTQVEKRPDGNWYYPNGSVAKPDVARFAEKRLKTFDIVNSMIKEPRIPGPDQSNAEKKRLSRFPIPKSSRAVPGGGASDAKLPIRPDQGRDQSPMPGIKSGSGFGPRPAPTDLAGRIVGSTDHQGVDFPVPIGTPVYAPNKAKVLDVTRTPFGGLTIVLGNKKGEITHKFLHLDKSLVKQDDIVQKGQEIAKSGKSGAWSTGAHLQWEKWVDGKPVNPKDHVNLD